MGFIDFETFEEIIESWGFESQKDDVKKLFD